MLDKCQRSPIAVQLDLVGTWVLTPLAHMPMMGFGQKQDQWPFVEAHVAT